jgi:hypothetical protein
LAGSEGIGLGWATMLNFLRIAKPSDTHFEGLRAELERLGTAGNLTADAHLAVLAIERGYMLYSTDADVARFSGFAGRTRVGRPHAPDRGRGRRSARLRSRLRASLRPAPRRSGPAH